MAARSCPVLKLEGSPHDRGLAHGEQLRGEIRAGVARWHDSVARSTDATPVEAVRTFLQETDFITAIQRWEPTLLEEVEGIALGAGASTEDILHYNLMDEVWLHHARARGVTSDVLHCSAIGVQGGNGRSVVAQNMDLPAHFDGGQAVLQFPQGDGVDVMVLVAAGQLALTGVNSRGVGVCVNALPDLPSARRGLPVSFVIRRLLACHTRSDARAKLRELSHASGQNYLVGDPHGVGNAECSSERVVELDTSEGLILHTNHPLGDHGRPVADDAHRQQSVLTPEDSNRRLARLHELLDGTSPGPSEVLEALSDREAPICRVPTAEDPSITFATVVMSLEVAPSLTVTAGPPTEAPATTLAF